jgi:hypothetical protein
LRFRFTLDFARGGSALHPGAFGFRGDPVISVDVWTFALPAQIPKVAFGHRMPEGDLPERETPLLKTERNSAFGVGGLAPGRHCTLLEYIE